MRRSKKVVAAFAALVAVLAGLSVPAQAAVKAGATCSKLHQVVSSAGYLYTCQKSGKKLIWSASGKVPTPSASPTPVPTPSASPTPTPTPSATPIPVLNFSNIFENRHLLSQVAWKAIISSYNSHPANLPTIETYVGPNTKPYLTDLSKRLAFVSQTLGDLPQPKKVRVIYYNLQDLQWGINKFTELAGAAEAQHEIQVHGGPLVKCTAPSDCNDGDAYVAADGTAYLAIGLPTNPTDDLLNQEKTNGTEMVEFYHSLQQYFYWSNNSYEPTRGQLRATNEPPFWLNIAGEGFAQQFYAIENNQYSVYEGIFPNNFAWARQALPGFSQKDINDYLDISNLNNYWSNYGCCFDNRRNIELAYIIGEPIMNIFIAIKGPNVMLDFHKAMASGISFDDEFASEFGLSWEQAEPTLSAIIWDEFQNNY